MTYLCLDTVSELTIPGSHSGPKSIIANEPDFSKLGTCAGRDNN